MPEFSSGAVPIARRTDNFGLLSMLLVITSLSARGVFFNTVIVSSRVTSCLGLSPVFYQIEASYQKEASNSTQLRMHKCPVMQINILMYMQ